MNTSDTFRPGQPIRTTDQPLSNVLRNRKGIIVNRYDNPIRDWQGPVEYLVRFDDGAEFYIAEHFLKPAYLYRQAELDQFACGICGGNWSAAMRGQPECQGHTWTSAAYLERQRAAHYGQPCDLGRVVIHQPTDCPVCRGQE